MVSVTWPLASFLFSLVVLLGIGHAAMFEPVQGKAFVRRNYSVPHRIPHQSAPGGVPAVGGEHFSILADEQWPHLRRQRCTKLSDAAFGPDGRAAILQDLDRDLGLLAFAHQVVATALAAVGLQNLARHMVIGQRAHFDAAQTCLVGQLHGRP